MWVQYMTRKGRSTFVIAMLFASLLTHTSLVAQQLLRVEGRTVVPFSYTLIAHPMLSSNICFYQNTRRL